MSLSNSRSKVFGITQIGVRMESHHLIIRAIVLILTCNYHITKPISMDKASLTKRRISGTESTSSIACLRIWACRAFEWAWFTRTTRNSYRPPPRCLASGWFPHKPSFFSRKSSRIGNSREITLELTRRGSKRERKCLFVGFRMWG